MTSFPEHLYMPPINPPFFSKIDFDSWLLSGLEAELAVRDPNYRIVRRRAAWLLGQWSGVKLSPQLRPRLYQLLLPLLVSKSAVSPNCLCHCCPVAF